MSRNKSTKPEVNILKFYKNFNLNESKSFCMAPWVHIHSNPSGVAAPCCIAESGATTGGVGNTRTQSIMEAVNSVKMNNLRKDMLTGVLNPECIKCHNHERQQVLSSRNMLNNEFQEFYDECMENTNIDGSLKEFKMRYFDIRFSNICNFKCRTCGAGFSSKWEQEDLKSGVGYARIYPKNDNPNFLQEVLDQVPNMKTAYFAGGEPLITEEHYILLEEMIRLGKTDIFLRYNTNMSNFKFKDKDIMSLWKQFKNGIDIYASIDHYGERAEYIRHGTDWALVEENLIKAKKTKFIKLRMNTVLSAFNFLTIGDFYQYLVDKGLYTAADPTYTLYNMSTPDLFTCHILPDEYKLKGKESLERAIALLESKKFRKEPVTQLLDALPWAMLYNTWGKHRYAFRSEVKRVDKLRAEDFSKVFPELAPLLDFDKRPVI
jgi:MoaA/NifB/PqqE/SkfB family radical SAM enzyme